MKYMHLQEQYPSGSAPSGAFLPACALNTTLYNAIPGASLNPANARVTLPAGDYEVQGSVATSGSWQRAVIFDTTHSAYIATGLDNPSPLAGPPQGPYLFVNTFFHLNVQADIEFRVVSMNAIPVNDGQPEVYSELVIHAL